MPISGTPTAVAAGGNYTPGAGSNRVVVMVARAKSAPSVTLTNISYNSITRVPTVTGRDNLGGDRDTCAICVFKESELPAGATAVTPTWSATPNGDQSIMCYTIDTTDQSVTVRSSGGNFGNSGNPNVPLTGLVVGDLVIGGDSLRSGSTGAGTPDTGFTIDDDFLNGDGGRFTSAHKVAAASSETYSIQAADTDDWAAAALALIPLAAAGAKVAWFRA